MDVVLDGYEPEPNVHLEIVKELWELQEQIRAKRADWGKDFKPLMTPSTMGTRWHISLSPPRILEKACRSFLDGQALHPHGLRSDERAR